MHSSRHGLRFTVHGFFLMRLDQYLRASRLVLRRTVAQELCEAGAVEVNDHPARASRTVREGDRLTLRRPDRALPVPVRTVPETNQASRAEAASLYEIIADVMLNNEA